MADLIAMLAAAAGAAPTGEYEIERSLRFNSADSAYLSRTFATSATDSKEVTMSFWVKRSALGTEQGLIAPARASLSSSVWDWLFFNTSNQLAYIVDGSYSFTTTAVFRDVSAWYHICFIYDSPNSSAKCYVNNVLIGSGSVTTNRDTTILNSSRVQNLFRYYDVDSTPEDYFSGYVAEFHAVDGQALTPSSFGEINAATGVWSPIEYTGTYGTNGFYLNFSDNSNTTAGTLGKDYSPNGNNWTPNNFSVTAGAGNDSLVDSPTRYGTDTGAGGEVRGNYCTLNPLKIGANATLANGNLDFASSAVAGFNIALGTIGMSSGKWYFEATVISGTGNEFGIATDQVNLSNYLGADAYGWGYYQDGRKFHNASGPAYASSFTTNDVIGIAFDADAGSITAYKNGVSQGVMYSGLPSGTYFFAVSDSGSSATDSIANFGQRPFAYTAPSGFKALVTTNLPNPTIVEGDDYFNTVLYDGTGSSQSITGVGFQPDFVWIKERNAAADHGLYDAVRGVQQQLESNTTTDETTESTGLTAFGTDGFTVGSLAQLNTSADTYVAWNWKESTTSKFDIVTYTGNGTARTISHNLGVVPNMIIVKARTTASTDQGWAVYHSANTANPETDYLLLNSTAATADLDTVWNDTAPTSTVFSVGTNALVNANNDTYVAYLFANVAGFSAFGSYTGNGSADGPFVYTGFRPRWILVKNSSNGSDNWQITDTSRLGYNLANDRIYTDANVAESNTQTMDILSNGFKIRSTNALVNTSSEVYIYAAFAESPFKFALGR